MHVKLDPELVSRGVSKSDKFKELVKVGASNLSMGEKSWPGGGVSGQPENPPGTPLHLSARVELSHT